MFLTVAKNCCVITVESVCSCNNKSLMCYFLYIPNIFQRNSLFLVISFLVSYPFYSRSECGIKKLNDQQEAITQNQEVSDPHDLYLRGSYNDQSYRVTYISFKSFSAACWSYKCLSQRAMLSEQDRDLGASCGFQNNRALLVHVRKVNPGFVVGIMAKQ